MEELGFWEAVHATSAGTASIVTYEGVREFMHGPALLACCSIITVVMFKLHHWHLRRLKANRARQ